MHKPTWFLPRISIEDETEVAPTAGGIREFHSFPVIDGQQFVITQSHILILEALTYLFRCHISLKTL